MNGWKGDFHYFHYLGMCPIVEVRYNTLKNNVLYVKHLVRINTYHSVLTYSET